MAAVAVEAGESGFEVGRVFSRAFATMAAHPFAVLGLALVFASLPSLITSAGLLHLYGLVGNGWLLAANFASTAVNTAFAVMLQGMVAPTVVAHSEGRSADIVDTFPPALMRFVPLVLVGLSVGFGFVFGLVLLIVPGVMLVVAWWVAAPAMAAEGLSVVDALRRSNQLTAGARWKLFGIDLLLGITVILLNLILRGAGIAPEPTVQIDDIVQMRAAALVMFAVALVVQTVAVAIAGVVHASAYVELREWKEGPAADALADVFR